MGVKGFGSVIKYSMFLFNAVILVAGAGLVGFGIYTRQNTSGITKFSSILGSNLLPTFSLAVIIAGAVIILLSFLGCCGAIKEVRCMLIAYFLLLLLMFLAFLVGGILLYAFRNRIEDVTLEQLRHQLRVSYGREGDEKVTESWDSMQKIFKCCGISGDVNSTESWAYYKTYSNWFQKQSDVSISKVQHVPASCCVEPNNTPNVTKCQGQTEVDLMPRYGPPVSPRRVNDQVYTTGCYTAFYNMIMGNMKALIGIGAGILFVMHCITQQHSQTRRPCRTRSEVVSGDTREGTETVCRRTTLQSVCQDLLLL